MKSLFKYSIGLKFKIFSVLCYFNNFLRNARKSIAFRGFPLYLKSIFYEIKYRFKNQNI